MTQTEAAAPQSVNPEQPLSSVPADWQANIIAFACHYCAFAAADLAGVMRLSYPPNVKVVRLPCTGKLDQIYILRAFERGVDGVFVAG
ncbi:MAG: hydrogenase iron-sulfur subunit [Desulfofustis sp. PB-SRB1]|jgi:F420-non-reducing hydrogenase iron-sulfur subunit|nr:hydrogenase iron-sulfur subunit [Desulfofustis sp. PB-SRB1]MBM1003187.1 hydrogenase iron-sulfur subunit [Desulfofustis sp. PB-SRB1]HBH27971.1 hydrogenase iron-sulfur subunit [Desulfofustis sp.]